MKMIRTVTIVVVFAAMAAVALQFTSGRPAHAASNGPIVSATSAGLAMDGGVVKLASVGRISETERAALRDAIAQPGVEVGTSGLAAAGRMARPGQQANGQGNLVDTMCQVVGDGLSAALVLLPSGPIATGCKWLVQALSDLVNAMAKALSAWLGKAVAQASAWVINTAVSLATGYDPSCQQTGPGGVPKVNAANPQCTGRNVQSRVLGIPASATYKAILQLSLMFAFPILIIALITAMVKQSFAEIGKTLLKLPFVWIMCAVGIYLVSVLVGFRDAFGNYLMDSANFTTNITSFFTDFTQTRAMALGPGLIFGVSMLLALFGGLMLMLILLLGDMVIMVSVTFMPLATVGLLWGGTAKWFKRVAELMGAFIIGKIVVIAMLCIAADMLAQGTA